jgi:putative selenium metabolism protein SsnA
MLIVHGRLVTWGLPNEILEDHAIFIEGGIVREIGPSAKLIQLHANEDLLDAHGQFVLPGNICAHTHYYGAFSRGMAVLGTPPNDLQAVLKQLWWLLDKSLTYDDIRYSTLVCLIDAIRHGTTLLFDHHSSPTAIDGSLDIIADAIEQAGVRSVLCYEVSDRDGLEKTHAGIAENVRFIRKMSEHPSDHISATFGLHASMTLSDATLSKCREENQSSGFHIHAAEGIADQKDSISKSGLRVVERLNTFNILGSSSILAHCVHVNTHEIDLLANTHTWVTHQPRSNMNNAVGNSPIEPMLRSGVKVCLGNDGLSNAMWEEWKTAYFIHKVWNNDPRAMPATQVVQMAIHNNADLAMNYFPDAPLGRIAPGYYADLIIVDYHPFTPITPDNLPWHIIFGFRDSQITTTIVAGRILMKDRMLLSLDEEEITEKACSLAVKVWERYKESI